ncbi:MAG: phosphosulfolactate synthase [Clostridia bacterium]|nr:phosphosulfolactate synthase [Clostridia bacterium]
MEKKHTWGSFLEFPLPGRLSKPRGTGLTMVMDKGLGLEASRDLLETAGNYVDYLKLGFGTSAFYSEELLRKKIALARSYSVNIYPGGTFLEVAILQKKVNQFLSRANQLGFRTLEVSDGTIELPPKSRREIIKQARMSGFEVITEVGKKDPRDRVSSESIIWLIQEDLESGANKVIIEARESGTGIGCFDAKGQLIQEEFETILRKCILPDKILWEAPLKNQQTELILRLGPNVNLGNVATTEVLALEALRVGLRGDTLRAALEQVREMQLTI